MNLEFLGKLIDIYQPSSQEKAKEIQTLGQFFLKYHYGMTKFCFLSMT